MKRYLFFALGIAMMLGVAVSTQELNAQVYSDFASPTLDGGKQFYDITSVAQTVEIPHTSFGLPPSWAEDLDDGYANIPVGFNFQFAGKEYSQVYVNINGFITFTSLPPLIRADYQEALFINSAGYPKNVVAPFWGDHYYRSEIDNAPLDPDVDNLFTMTSISYLNQTIDGRKQLIIQWKNLNINYEDPVTHLPITSSVATFQVILWENTSTQSNAGDIEFAYGPAGADLSVSQEQKLITAGSAIGIKGESNDYINALEFDELPYTVRTSTKLSGTWQPSNGTDTTILMSAQAQLTLLQTWGDGDVDLSKYKDNKHEGMPQNRYVTVNDAWMIMRSEANRIPLDSVRGRAAYHGDVDHNGRYFFDHNSLIENPVGSGIFHPEKKLLPWKDEFYWENLDHPDWSVSDLNQLYFEVVPLDAAKILAYISARVPELPWRDSIPLYGKLISNEEVANNVTFGDAVKLSEGMYQIPVYLNGLVNGPFAVDFDVNCEIVGVNTNSNEDQMLMADAGADRVVIIGNGEFDNQDAIAYLTVRANEVVKFSNIRFNEDITGTQGISLETESMNPGMTLKAQPNPFAERAMINVNIVEAGVYTLSVFDAAGNKVAMIASQDMANGLNTFEWNGKDVNGNQVATGVYMVRLTGENTYVTEKIIFMNK